MKTYVTFGFEHKHQIGDTILDRDCVAVIEGPDAETNRAKAFELFGSAFCFEYPEDYWDEAQKLPYFSRGYIHIED